ncbi:MAG: nickel transporter [Alphaproteobacteria bacterium]|nr:nickel transporter [Alphaproteobacteria bacterium]
MNEALRVIPVIDLKGGLVVRAVRGDRWNYRPIETPLAPGTSNPVIVARALLDLCTAFDSLYVADIDAIAGGGRDPERKAVMELVAAFPGLRFFLDDGAASLADVERLAGHPAIIPVIGTESVRSTDDLAEIAATLAGEFALSLDWRGDVALGPAELFHNPDLWPHTVIVMTLDRVGGRAGPDFERLGAIKAMAGPRQVLAAGGVRGLDDLRALKSAGCGALVATALHEGAFEDGELHALIAK